MAVERSPWKGDSMDFAFACAVGTYPRGSSGGGGAKDKPREGHETATSWTSLLDIVRLQGNAEKSSCGVAPEEPPISTNSNF